MTTDYVVGVTYRNEAGNSQNQTLVTAKSYASFPVLGMSFTHVTQAVWLCRPGSFTPSLYCKRREGLIQR